MDAASKGSALAPGAPCTDGHVDVDCVRSAVGNGGAGTWLGIGAYGYLLRGPLSMR